MTFLNKLLFSVCFAVFAFTAKAQEKFPIVANGKATKIYVDKNEASVVNIASEAFKNDIKSISAITPIIDKQVFATANYIDQYVIIAGTESSNFIQLLSKKNPSLVSTVHGKWETFTIDIINNPLKGIKKALVICGSDPRGTAYGLFEVSRRIGVSPMVWWADVHPEKKSSVMFSLEEKIIESPSVKYRGIFLNDEDWGLQPWAAYKMDPDVKDIGPKTYEKIFELLLRLKGNYIWPAMHPSTKAFWYYPENAKIAKKYGIVLGASHCEPMLRNNVFEWNENFEAEYGVKTGEWRYDTNQKQIYTYWEDRVKEAVNNEAVYTVGMRGIHDGAMPGPPSLALKVPLMEKVISDQRKVLNQYKLNNREVPQIFCPYKEVLDIYRLGLKLPDDITTVWADDNHGYIRQVSNPEERKRIGGSGVYYHLSYWGRPNDYLWLSSISPSLIAHEMGKAYRFGADRLWVFNVGDIKPAEAEMQFALDLAWNVKAWPEDKASDYAYFWAKEIFGEKLAKSIAEIKNEYYRLAASGKPEHLLGVKFTTTEMSKRLIAYQLLNKKVKTIKPLLRKDLGDAYFQLVEYPVQGAMLMNQKIFYAKESFALAKNNDQKAIVLSSCAKIAFDSIQLVTNFYNTKIADGKWNRIMSWQPRNQSVFNMPKVATIADLVPGKNQVETKTENTIRVEPQSFKKFDRRSAQLKTIIGLGTSDRGLCVSPISEQPFNLENIDQAPYIEYQAKVKSGRLQIDIKALPAFPLYDGMLMGYIISVDNEKPRWVSLTMDADTPKWDMNVLRGYMNGTTEHQIKQNEGMTTIRIYFTSPGFVLSEMVLEQKL